MGGNLQEVYQEIYLLVSRVGFDAQYVESLAPVERLIYLVHYKDEQERQEEEDPDSSMLLGDMSNYIDSGG